MEFFVAGVAARAAAELAGVRRNSAIRFFRGPREKIAAKPRTRPRKRSEQGAALRQGRA